MQAFLFVIYFNLVEMNDKIGPALLVLGYLLILTADIFFMNHLLGARNVYWTGFTCSMIGGALVLYKIVRR